ncbi:MAG: exodeoxyribonuclease VII large subunit [Anaerolineales bacterium]|nr:exodeoxyribonuclease VII large subunit [Anaerolineales bacterium]
MSEQLSLFPEPKRSYSIIEINTYLRTLLEGDSLLQDIWVEGEISNLSRPKSGHLYFTLKDSQAAIRCVMWRSQTARLAAIPQDGMAVEVHGSISVYEAAGQYQLYADQIRPAGEGLLYQEFNRLKNKLEAEGLFDPAHKRPIPEMPAVIGVVTSPTGAAIQDILNTLKRRYPLARVVLAPAAVQGDAAPGEIASAIHALNQQIQPDVILVGRGGGSIEDLWAFNQEIVARAIFASDAPVISGVGHEIDFTISDFVADLRAPTPTAAAELAVPDQIELAGILLERRETLQRQIKDRLNEQRWALGQTASRLQQVSPAAQLAAGRQTLDELFRRGERALQHHIKLQQTRLSGLSQQLDSLSPQNVLRRGYAAVSSGGRPVTSLKDIQPGNQIHVQVRDGSFDARVTAKEEKNEQIN